LRIPMYFFVFWTIVLFANSLYWERTSYQQAYIKGTLPKSAPEGFLKGTPVGIVLETVVKFVPWQGKKFDSKAHTGINIIGQKDGTTKNQFPFKTWEGKGARDATLSVFKIDYDIAENAFWLRTILDEVVEVAPGQFLGKMQIIPFNGVAFTLGFFQLKK
jgi:hypothetical protein